MPASNAAPGHRILRLWNTLEPWPAGDLLFSFLLGRMAPYSGSVFPRVRRLEPGRCRVEMRDRRRVRNHLDSVHATALVTLGELATGLATLTALPPGIRGILTGLEAEYTKKARGRLAATCGTRVPDLEGLSESVEHRAAGEIRDEDGDPVATVRATWRLSPPD